MKWIHWERRHKAKEIEIQESTPKRVNMKKTPKREEKCERKEEEEEPSQKT